ncbi:DUF1273 domain-containing protein [Streptococcus caprae]|uniref:UPF0398 protein ACFORF_02225 n=1 Tax=Streptococcus caprae TaxID=1640501 RepID=A0ABV8CTJ0_9STRE
MTAILITGYKNSDLGVFNEQDPKIKVIKKAIRTALVSYLEEGVDWFVFTGNLGFELWALEVAKELQGDYPIKLSTIFPFANHGENWNESNQLKLSQFRAVDFSKYCYDQYENPGQFRSYNQFLIDNTDGAYVFYDTEHETNLKYFVNKMKEKENFNISFLTFEHLNEVASEFDE